MFRLKATLVARTALQPWRTGWSVARAVDFSLPAKPVIAPDRAVLRNGPVGAERACFIDEDWTVTPGATEGRKDANHAAGTAPVSDCDDTPEPARVRAWWSLSGKP